VASAEGGKLQAASALAKSASPRNVFTLFDPGDPQPFLMHVLDRALAAPRAIGRRALKSIRSVL